VLITNELAENFGLGKSFAIRRCKESWTGESGKWESQVRGHDWRVVLIRRRDKARAGRSKPLGVAKERGLRGGGSASERHKET
jgi:hypothetical protein